MIEVPKDWPPKGYLANDPHNHGYSIGPSTRIWTGKEWVPLQSTEGQKVLNEIVHET